MLTGKKKTRNCVGGLEKNVRVVCSAGKSQWIFQRKDTQKKKILYYSLLMKIIVELNSI